MLSHTALFFLWLFQLLDYLVHAHPGIYQLLNHTLSFGFLRFFSSLLIGGGFLGFQFT